MKKILSLTFLALFAIGFTSCSEESLNTTPTTEMSGDLLFSNANSALMPLNGIYRAMYRLGPSHQFFGISSYNIIADVMADDFLMHLRGSGWFWRDCTYDMKHRYASTDRTPYVIWDNCYTYICNANYILAAKETMEGLPDEVNYVMGQAYAIRAYSYFLLAQWYARTYVGHEDEKGVPVYTEPTTSATVGRGRGTLRDVYAQINNDIDSAIILLDKAIPRLHKSHIDKYVANGIKARICLVQERWQDALDAAQIAQKGGKPTDDILGGMNDINQSDVIWGAEIIAEQSTKKRSFFNHMDAVDSYAGRARKQINIELYDKMGAGDIRRHWWNPSDPGNNQTHKGGYQQVKFRWKKLEEYTGDYIWMRVPEMILTQAEALCMLHRDGEAQQVLNDFMKKYRDKDYNCTKTGTDMGRLTSDYVGSLREEIIIQRRIELWGEYGRIYDIRRLKQGFKRTLKQGWTPETLIEGVNVGNSETWDWVMTIPQQEFDRNKALNFEEDQNPIELGN